MVRNLDITICDFQKSAIFNFRKHGKRQFYRSKRENNQQDLCN